MTSTLLGPGRPGVLRSINDRAVLSLLLNNTTMTRPQIIKATGLSSPTTSQLVARLIEAGLICET
ncbi:MAG: winged helix-turn-helix domain-containing protein, partial [Propionibacteriaceae bacterium]|nr:winged helix-turn-helix domain-containing protein [Propionibacteriaceae bacterium]